MFFCGQAIDFDVNHKSIYEDDYESRFFYSIYVKLVGLYRIINR